MASGRSDLVDVAAVFRMEKGGGIAIWDGQYLGSKIGSASTKEVWTWLPKSLVEDNGDGTFSMPEWLAKEKGLI